jgi:2-C-methyl-D-erythritol 2,4-cyclodiphosphate synthase
MANLRIGHGYDVHQLVMGRPCVIGGVTVPFDKGLLGHSDADVLLHAICDALLGAASLGDIGQHFPASDMRYQGINSRELLRHVVKLLNIEGYEVSNIDSTVICELPKLTPYTTQMRINIAEDCLVNIDVINVKATTTEKLGFTGRGEGIAAEAVCLLQKI